MWVENNVKGAVCLLSPPFLALSDDYAECAVFGAVGEMETEERVIGVKIDC